MKLRLNHESIKSTQFVENAVESTAAGRMSTHRYWCSDSTTHPPINLTIIVAGSGSGTVTDVATNGQVVNCDDSKRQCSATVTDPAIHLRIATANDSTAFIAWAGDCLTDVAAGDCYFTKEGSTAVAVVYLRRTTVAAGAFFTCGLRGDGTIRCWGENEWGQLGDGSIHSAFDGAVRTVDPISRNIVDISAGAHHVCALDGIDGSVWCWGGNENGQIGIDSTAAYVQQPSKVSLAPAIAIAAGAYHTCAIVVNGDVACWGRNEHGQVDPDAIGVNQKKPRFVVEIHKAKHIAAGAYHSCAGLGVLSVKCWGYNHDMELGTKDPPDHGWGRVAYFAEAAGGSVSQLAGSVGAGTLPGNFQAGGYHTCSLDTEGHVNCWGYAADGQLEGISHVPFPVAAGPSGLPLPARAIAAGGYHSCAVGSDMHVYCWGNDNFAQRGSGDIHLGAQTITLVIGILQAISISAGAFHTCAVVVLTIFGAGAGMTLGKSELQVTRSIFTFPFRSNLLFESW